MDLVKDGVNGYLAEVGDSRRLANRLIDVLALSEQNWRRMSDAALRTAESLTWEDAVLLFERALELTLERFAERPPEGLPEGLPMAAGETGT